MTAYVISEVEILDEREADRYRVLASKTIAQYGGRYIVRGGPVQLVEGERDDRRQFVIVEFPSLDRARTWYRSPEYAEALKIRKTVLDRTLVFIDGVAETI
jgi:uncharacterized protein (DUF1330 family)